MMHSIYAIASNKESTGKLLSKTERFSVLYHDIFDYPLTFSDLIKWNSSGSFPIKDFSKSIVCQDGYYFLKGRGSLVYKRVLRNRISAKKLEIAKKASGVLAIIPGIKMVAVTGSLAMDNAGDESDIDLFIITGKNLLWITRILSYSVLKVFGFDLRKAGGSNKKDNLCLNMWMDETDLIWKRQDRNPYTAHEIAQILPLVNKNKTYEKFLYKNKWILKFWPNSVRIENCKLKIENSSPRITLFEKIVYKLQCLYMKKKITREVITPTRAIFHPQDWGNYILSRLNP